MKSVNHQFLEFSDDVVARYVKTTLQPLTGYRLNPRNSVNPNERLDFLLATPEDNVEYTPYNEDSTTKVKQTKLTYEDEVLELYSALELKAFLRMNRLLLENGFLAEYSEEAPQLDLSNALTDKEVRRIAQMKTTLLFKERLATLTSVHTLQAILNVMESLDDVKYAHVKLVRSKIDELNGK